MKISMKKKLWNLFNFVTSIIFLVPCEFVRRIYIQRFVNSGKKCKWGINIRVYGVKRVTIGNDVVINRNVLIDGRAGVKIGNSVDIGEYANIWSLEHDPNSDSHECRGNQVIIGDYVWIAPRSTILPGIKIGNGAVVANGAIVTKDVPEKAIVAGIPAKIIGHRSNKLNYKLNN